MNEPVVAGGVAGLQIPGLGAGRLLVPFDQGAGAAVHDHPLQMRGRGDSASRCGGQRQRWLLFNEQLRPSLRQVWSRDQQRRQSLGAG